MMLREDCEYGEENFYINEEDGDYEFWGHSRPAPPRPQALVPAHIARIIARELLKRRTPPSDK